MNQAGANPQPRDTDEGRQALALHRLGSIFASMAARIEAEDAAEARQVQQKDVNEKEEAVQVHARDADN